MRMFTTHQFRIREFRIRVGGPAGGAGERDGGLRRPCLAKGKA